MDTASLERATSATALRRQEPHNASRLANVAIIVLVIGWSLAKSQHYHNAITWDAFGYYLYLPALFIHSDIAIKDPAWFNTLFETYAPSGTVYQINYLEDGGRAIKYPIGLSILWTPFFALAHIVAGLVGLPQDGLSRPYHWAMVIGSWVYFTLGLLWVRRILRDHFSDGVTMVTILTVVLGTNLLYMVVFDPLMPHAFLFTVYAGIIYHSQRWHRGPNVKDSIVLGILLGIAASIRNTELIAIAIPLFWGAWDVKAQFKRFWQFKHLVLLAALFFLILCLPQLLYWKYVTGSFFYMSYTNAGEGLDLLKPNIWNVLFSYRKGLLIYTPIAVLGLIGIPLLLKYLRNSFPALSIYLVLNFWIVSSWTIWWYADSFGNRGFIQSYAALALPLACVVHWGWRTSRAVYPIKVGIFALIAFSLFQTWQTSAGILHSSRMTKEAYWAIFGRVERPADLERMLVVQRNYDGSIPVPDLDRYRSVVVDMQDMEQVDPGFPQEHYTDPHAYSGQASYRLDQHVPWSMAIGRPFWQLTDQDHVFALYTIHMFIPEHSPHPDVTITISMEHEGRKYGELLHEIVPTDLVPGTWNAMSIWYVSPTIRDPQDLMRAHVWLRDTTPVWVDDARLEIFEPLGR